MRQISARAALAIVASAALVFSFGGCSSGTAVEVAPPETEEEVSALESTPAVSLESLEVLPTDVELLRRQGKGTASVELMIKSTPAVYYVLCKGSSDIEVNGLTKGGTWTVPCDGVVSRQTVYGAKRNLRVALVADAGTEWALILARPKS